MVMSAMLQDDPSNLIWLGTASVTAESIVAAPVGGRGLSLSDGGEDPFDDFEEDDFDDDFDDDFEEDWEDDLTQDEEFPDTFGGSEDDQDQDKEKSTSPFKDDPDFDD
jgi:hypothetical protein